MLWNTNMQYIAHLGAVQKRQIYLEIYLARLGVAHVMDSVSPKSNPIKSLARLS
ncbi:hypothetical protein J2R76_003830 [Bradyrhizobium sp. USDA 4532]|nr:hypothetical protein [Bradyrhizobium sp. USDA 4545]MCP1920239.1 hypothetical protein [Bradyrhizobium sp. USDA 4532]